MARSASGKFSKSPKKARSAKRGFSKGRARARHGGKGRKGGAPMLGGKGQLFGLDIVTALGAGIAAVGTGMLTNVVVDKVPFPAVKSGWGKVAARRVLTVLVGFGAKKALPARFATPLIVGSLAGFGTDVVQAAVTKFMPTAPLSGYEPLEEQLAAIEAAYPGSLNGLLAVDGELNGLGTVGQGVFDLYQN